MVHWQKSVESEPSLEDGDGISLAGSPGERHTRCDGIGKVREGEPSLSEFCSSRSGFSLVSTEHLVFGANIVVG